MELDLPSPCLLPRGVERLLVAGRCIGGSHVAHSSYRVMPIVMATGQGAGACAAPATARGCDPHERPPGDVQDELRRQQASLGG